MKKACLLILLTFILSCSKSDDIQSIPLQEDYFELSISEITDNSAKISWDISEKALGEGINKNEVKYSLFLNDSLVLENSNINEYVLISLDSNNSYSGKIIAHINVENQAELTYNFQTLDSSKNYFPLEVGNLWYYTKILNYPLDYRTYKIKREVISSEIINNHEQYLIKETELYYKREQYYEGHEDYQFSYPCITTITEYFLRFEDDKLIKTQNSNEEVIIDFNETSFQGNAESVTITEECDIEFYSIYSCVYERIYFSLGYSHIQTFMKDVGLFEFEAVDENYFGEKITLVGYKPANSLIIGEEHDVECD